MHIKTTKYLLQNKNWDFLLSIINGSDRINHSFWRYQDKHHRKYEEHSEFENVLKNYYKYMDRKFGEILELIDDETIVILLSDHGITRMHTRVNLTDWLIKEGYMTLKKTINEKCVFKPDIVDWKKTKAFAVGAYDGEIFINLKGKEPEGCVEEKDYDSLIEELEKKLKEIPGEDNSKLNTFVFKKKFFFRGKCEESAPDIVVYFDNLQYGCNTSLIGNETLWSPQTAMGSDDACHSRQGIFIMNKSKQKGDIGEVNYIDIAPTILDKLGIGIPKDMEGKIIE
jgi:predicted AlkP superfamily phosphohydrolase/phosphomutase